MKSPENYCLGLVGEYKIKVNQRRTVQNTSTMAARTLENVSKVRSGSVVPRRQKQGLAHGGLSKIAALL